MKRNILEIKNLVTICLALIIGIIGNFIQQNILITIVYLFCLIYTIYYYTKENAFRNDTYYTEFEINEATRKAVLNHKYEFLILALNLVLVLFCMNINSLVYFGVVIRRKRNENPWASPWVSGQFY